MYDDDKSQYSLFDINEVFDDAKLAAEAVAAYWGYNAWDTDLPLEQVRKAMNVGAVSSILFSKALSGSRNIISGDIEGSIRDLHSQLKNDRVLGDIVANFYDKVQDQRHLELFVDAFTKAGVNNTRLRKALVDLRNSVDENSTLVKRNYVDEDIRLMENAWALYNNGTLNEAVKKAGLDKYGDVHKQIIIEGAARITARQKTEDQISEDLRELSNMQYRHNDVVQEMLDEATTLERLKQLQDENPELANIVT